jgi:hypothetical protein
MVGAGLLVPTATALAAFADPATGGSAISADEFGTSRYTPLQGPSIKEESTAELALHSTTILNAPSGFQFEPGFGTASVDGIECDLRGQVTVTATQAKLTVTHASTVSGCQVWFIGLEVQPTSGSGLASGNITKTGTSAAPGGAANYGTLTEVAGAVSQLVYVTQPSATNSGGTAFGQQPKVLARDQFGNSAAGRSVTLSIAPGTGPTGSHLTCSSNPVRTANSGIADFTGAGCRIDRAGSYKLRAAIGSVTTNSGTLTVKVGPASRIVFRAYPAATTNTTFAPQPKVAIVDAGGNTVTTYPTSHITLGINLHASTFTCSSGFPVAQAIHGVATFTGCKQTTVGSGYRLTAWFGNVSVMGRSFKVVH